MSDFQAKHIIEALRSGVPSRTVGACFSEARPEIMRRISSRLENVRESGKSDGMIFTGRYGEGKTHLLNTFFETATHSNMVVSLVPLGKETPLDKAHLLYQKVMARTYLPGAKQPGITSLFEEMTAGDALAGEMMAYAAKSLETDKLYFMLKAFLGTQEEDERFAFLSDFEGDFAGSALIKRSYRRVTGQPAKFSQNFSKTKHAMDYFCFMSHLFRQKKYAGWLILLDEAELLGRLGKKTRLKNYLRMQEFLTPGPGLEGIFTLIAMSSSYAEDVIDKKHEFENAEAAFAEDTESKKAVLSSLNAILKAPELAPVTKAEIGQILMKIQEYHGRAYDWTPSLTEETLVKATEAGGYLLRTKIRSAIEILDQLYQYGEAGDIKITKLGEESYEEDETPDLGEMADLKADTGDASELISGEEMKNRLGITQEELNRISDVDFA